MIPFVYDDGGRKAAGFRGETGDCVTRAVAIATGRPYREIYDALYEHQAAFQTRRKIQGSASPRDGVSPKVYKQFLSDLGWDWTPKMRIGSGVTMHVDEDELPGGVLILRLSGHIATVIDGVLHDTYDCSRDGTRAVYGYWSKEVSR